MLQKSIGILALTLAVLLAVPTFMMAAPETISGKVESVDVKTGQLVVEISEDDSVELKASKEMLKGVKPGDEITIKIEEGSVISIEKNDEDD